MSDMLPAILQYLRQPNTDYAFMLTGPWGSGKTHFWKHSVIPAIEGGKVSNGEENPTAVYVSMYGVDDPEQIGAAVLSQIHPVLMKAGKALTVVGRAALKFFRLDPLGEHVDVETWFASIAGDRPLIICCDDLERANMPAVEVLGHLNLFVEHSAAKVIIICNEGEILSPPGQSSDESTTNQIAAAYRRTKEKVVRITRTFQLDHKSAMDSIVAEYKGASHFYQYLQEHRENILRLFVASRSNNLRILKYGLSALQIAFEAMHEIDSNNGTRAQKLIPTLLPVTFDLHAAEITPDDARRLLVNGASVIYSEAFGDDRDEPTPLSSYVKRYDAYEFVNDLLTSEALADFVTTGYLDRAQLQTEVEREAKRVTPGQQSVRTLTNNWYDMEDDQYQQLLEQSLKAVRAGEIVDWNKLVQLGRIIDQAIHYQFSALTQEQAKAIFEAGLAAQIANGTFERHEIWHAQHEVMLIEGDGAFVQWVRDRLVETNAGLDDESKRQRVNDAFDSIDGEAIEFGRLISGRDDGGIGDKPIGEYVKAEDFVTKALNSSNRSKSQLGGAISERYKHSLNTKDDEWLEKVDTRLEQWINDNAELKAPSRMLIDTLRHNVHVARQRLARVEAKKNSESSAPSDNEQQVDDD